MEGTPYQPPLLTLDDMLNLSNDDDNWDSNAFNISNFFEPIVSSTRENVQQRKEASSTSHASQYVNPFVSPIKAETVLPGTNEDFQQFHTSCPPDTVRIKQEPFDQSFDESFLNVSDEADPGLYEPSNIQEPTQKTPTHEDFKKIFICDKRRKAAISQLQSLINTLKRYSKTLQSFLDNEGDMILEQHAAQELLGQNAKESSIKLHPFDLAHSVTQAVVSHVGRRSVLSRLPRQRPVIWRSSDLLLLQKSILQSAIARREFFLDCRYSQLLLEMGFDLEDVERLQKAPTRHCELTVLRAVMEEHECLSKIKGSLKKPIQTVIIKDNPQTRIPRVFSLPNPETLVNQKWEKLVEIRRETLISNISEKDIDWLFVIKQMSRATPMSNVEEEICKLTYSHLIDPKFNNAVWRAEEVMKLRSIRERFTGSSWTSIAKRLGTQRTPFSCFVKYKIHCVQSTPQLLVQKQSTLEYYIQRYKGNVAKIDQEMFKVTGHYMKPMTLLVGINRTLSPRTRHGHFSIVEDVLLLLTMECYREHLSETENFDPVAYALPWRYITQWRLRFGRLMTGFYHKMWSLEEDQCLWNLVQEHGPKYKVIQRSFPHKDRKQCRARYVHLERILQSMSLQNYHVMYNSRRKNFDFQKLNPIAEYLEMTIKAKAMGCTRYVREADLEFLRRRRAPSDRELECYLLTFQRGVMCVALDRLLGCLLKIQEKYREFSSEMSIAQYLCRTNRRKFDPKCPASTASALHLSCAKLVPMEQLDIPISKFEEDIYTYYQFFSMGSVKKKTKRNLPSLDLLRKLPSIARLIQPADYRPGEPVFVITGQTPKPDIDAEERKEAEVLEEIQKQTKGGARKGAKKRATKIREDKVRAARMRWQKSKLGNVDEQVTMKENIPSDDHNVLLSVVKNEAESADTTDSFNGSAVRNAAVAMINDHAYILPVENPTDLRNLTLGQLFAKMGQSQVKND
ncbi:snRNA-activating protein complex subunit 4 [Orchesella cincta]|uniref:snRNA-activating protein complex subunit 4 n=1 Tax=Orchesella cincta TaxID=48709 RepID=A0A1D2NE05_ORCCI|nr:snRNA-activating protein complex subunit 4 [Orchesella cincta]